MRIDTHAYIGHWPYRQLRGSTCEALVRRLDEFGIDQAWVGNIHGLFYRNCHEANRELAAQIAPFRDRLMPFAVINPTYPEWEEDLKQCAGEFGMRGVRLYPQYHGYLLEDEACLAAVLAAQALDLVCAFTVRMVDERQQSWLDTTQKLSMDDIAELISRAPKGKFQILHAAPQALEKPESKATLKAARVMMDTVYGTGVPVGFISAYPLAKAVDTFGADHFAFGTATPFRDYPSHILRLATFKEAGTETFEKLWHKNAQDFLRA